MYKYFANSPFDSKIVEFLPQCHSTNDELVVRVREGSLQEGYCILADKQAKGKGLRGNQWESEAGKNLLFSIYLKPKIPVDKIHFIYIAGALAVQKLLTLYVHPLKVEIKWPNDIYVNDKKLCGMLVETTMHSGKLDGVVLGIGLNVNQTQFSLENATSIQSVSGIDLDIWHLCTELIELIGAFVADLKDQNFPKVLGQYESLLRWRGEKHLFSDHEIEFEGEILGVADDGRLMVKHNAGISSFDVKELIYLR